MLQRAPQSASSTGRRGPLAAAGLATVSAGAAAAAAPELVLTGLVLLAACRMAVLNPALAAGTYVAAVYLRLPELATTTWGLPAVGSQALTVAALGLGARRWYCSSERPRALVATTGLIAVGAAVVLLSSLAALDPRAAVAGAGALVLDSTVALAVVVLVRDRSDLVAALWGVVLAGSLVAASGLALMVSGAEHQLAGLAQNSASTLVGRTSGARLGGQYGDANFFAQALVLAVPLAVALAVVSRRRAARLAAVAAICVIVPAVLFTYSRGGLVVLTLLLVGCVVRFRRARWPAAAVLATALLVVTFTGQPSGPAGDLVARASSSSEDPSVRQRTRGLETAAGMALEHPVVGTGHDNWALRQSEYAPGAGLAEPRDPPLKPHSLYLHVAAETGALGLMALGALVLVPLLRLRRRERRHPCTALLAWGVGCGLLGWFAAAALLPRAYPRQTWLVVALAMAAGAVLSSRDGFVDDQAARP